MDFEARNKMSLSAVEKHNATLSTIQERLKNVFPDAKLIKAIDNTPPQSIGKGAHVTLQINCSDFKGLTLIRRHRLVSAVVDDLVESNRIHAISYLLSDK